MTPGRRLLSGLVAAAAILLVGRALALIYSDYAWYNALGMTSLWAEKAGDLTAIHVTSALFSGLFALVNLYAIRRSIVSLALPRRLGNVQFGEAVPARYLDRSVIALSLAVALFLSRLVPNWEQIALLRNGARFGESDPFFQLDLSFYVAWLPFEAAIYQWTLALLVSVSAVVIGLYALTPSLRWERGSFHLSTHVRRHLAILGGMFLLAMAWSYRLDMYHLLINGTGTGGAFSYLDHQWLIPAYLSLLVITIASAVLVAIGGWTGQLRTIFFTVSAVLVLSIILDLVLPSFARHYASADGSGEHQQPYASTRAAFTRRAYGDTLPGTPPHEVTRFASFGDSARVSALVGAQRSRFLIYPEARGSAIVTHGANVPAPALGMGLGRLAHAWSEQRLDLLWGPYPADVKIARRRDISDRVSALAPIFAQGSQVNPGYLADTLIWIVELYSASSTYPLSAHYRLAGENRSYFRHAGTALLNSRNGRMMIVADPSPDPIAVAWRVKYPEIYRPGRPDILDALTPNPTGTVTINPPRKPSSGSDSAFRHEVAHFYSKMRQALQAGDLKAFGAAYDSLGAIIGRD